jgi:hypothetical protein
LTHILVAVLGLLLVAVLGLLLVAVLGLRSRQACSWPSTARGPTTQAARFWG